MQPNNPCLRIQRIIWHVYYLILRKWKCLLVCFSLLKTLLTSSVKDQVKHLWFQLNPDTFLYKMSWKKFVYLQRNLWWNIYSRYNPIQSIVTIVTQQSGTCISCITCITCITCILYYVLSITFIIYYWLDIFIVIIKCLYYGSIFLCLMNFHPNYLQ